MHIGHNNTKYTYYLSDNLSSNVPLSETTAEKDLGLIVDNNLNFHEHLATTVKKVSTVKKTFLCLESNMIKKLFTNLVRMYLNMETVSDRHASKWVWWKSNKFKDVQGTVH